MDAKVKGGSFLIGLESRGYSVTETMTRSFQIEIFFLLKMYFKVFNFLMAN